MKRLVLFAALAAWSTSAGAQSVSGQEKEIIEGIARKFEAAFNDKNPAAVAALYTADPVEVTPFGIAHGRSGVEKRVENAFKGNAEASHLVIKVETAQRMGDAILSAGEWSNNALHGYWSAVSVKEGGEWKHQEVTTIFDPPKAEAASAAK